MSELLYRSNLKLWMKADGMRGSSWNDSSGTQAVGAFSAAGAPAIVYPTTGYPPYISFGGAADFFTGPAPSTFMAAGVGTIFLAINATAAVGTNGAAVNDDVILGGQSTSNPCVAVGTIASVPTVLFDLVDGGGRKTVSTPITLGAWHVVIIAWDNSKIYISVDDPMTLTSVARTDATATLTGTAQIGKNASGSHLFNGLVGEILAFKDFMGTAGVAGTAEQNRATVYNYLRARWLGTGDPLEIARDKGSRVVWSRGIPRMHIVAKDVPISTPLPTNPFDDTREAFFSHPRGIEPSGQGWRESFDWQPRPGRIEQITYDYDKLTCEVRAADLRPFRHSLVDSGLALYPGPRREGPMVSSAGAVRVYSCDVVTQYISAVDGISVVQALPDEEKATPYGLSLHGVQNYMTRSALVSGTTGLTPAGTGVNGSAIALDTTNFVFDTNVQSTPQSLKFTAGSPHTADLKETWPASDTLVAFTGSAAYLSILHNGQGSPAVQVQRSSDSKWLQDLNGNWGASAVWISIPTPGAPYPTNASIIYLSLATAGTYTVTMGLPSGGTSGRTWNFYYSAITGINAPLANGVLKVTDATSFQFGNASDALTEILLTSSGVGGPLDAQTIAFMLRPSGNPTSILLIGASPTAAQNWSLSFSGGVLSWTATAAGSYTASKSYAPALGVAVPVVLRRISSHGDLGMAPYTLSLFVDRAKGTDAIEVTHPPDGNIMTWGYVSGNILGLAVSNFVASPYAWSDAECQAWGL